MKIVYSPKEGFKDEGKPGISTATYSCENNINYILKVNNIITEVSEYERNCELDKDDLNSGGMWKPKNDDVTCKFVIKCIICIVTMFIMINYIYCKEQELIEL